MSIPSSPRRSRIAHFKAPFIISIAGSAALAPGCGGKSDADTTEHVTANPPPSESLAQSDAGDGLPPRLPTTAHPCDGESPSYITTCGGPIWRCVDGEWEAAYFSCNPPPTPSEVCPTSAAEVGSFCGSYLGGLTCEYQYCYDATAPMRRCDESTLLWEEILPPTCNPPPPDSFPCEATLPIPGSDCSSIPERVCSYPGGCESPSTAVCRSGQWLVTYSSGPACNPPAVVPVCPQQAIARGAGCAYEGQACSNVSCELGAESHDGYVCTAGKWEPRVVSCPPDNAPDVGAADGGG